MFNHTTIVFVLNTGCVIHNRESAHSQLSTPVGEYHGIDYNNMTQYVKCPPDTIKVHEYNTVYCAEFSSRKTGRQIILDLEDNETIVQEIEWYQNSMLYKKVYSKGMLQKLESYHNGELTGLYAAWFANGHLKYKGILIKGVKQGIWFHYNKRGVLILRSIHSSLESNFDYYDENGQKICSETFSLNGEIIDGNCPLGFDKEAYKQ